MDRARVAILRDLLASTGWVERTRDFGRALRRAPHEPGGLLVVGTPHEDPWHFAAHLDDEARFSDQPKLAPVLVRWTPPPNAPAHLSIGFERLEQLRRGESLFVVAPDTAPAPLLERVADARKAGATIFTVDADDPQLESLAHEALTVPSVRSSTRASDKSASDIVVPEFEVVTHLVSAAAGELDTPGRRGRAGIRERLAKLLDAIGDE